MGRKCAVPGCSSVASVGFPHPSKDVLNRFTSWLIAIRSDDLAQMTPMDVYLSKRICRRHFSVDAFVQGSTALKRTAIPSLLLPEARNELASPSKDSDCLDMSQPSSDRLLSQSSGSLESFGRFSDIQPPSSELLSVGSDTVKTVITSTPTSSESVRDGGPTGQQIEMPGLSSQSSSLDGSSEVFAWPLTVEKGASLVASQSSNIERRRIGRKQTHKKETRRVNILKDVGARFASDLTPKAKYLFKQTQLLRRKIRTSSKKLCVFKKRLIFAESCLKSGLSRNVSDLPPPVAAFLRCQLREAGKKNKGHRFTLDDKILSLSLLKRSGRAYNFLSNLFVLPSRRTLVRLLSSLSFQPGINDDMFNHLSVIVENQLSEMDKLCVLLFDEMSLTPHLEYNVHNDIIEGFEDLGGGKRCEKFANKALVFMVRGICKKFKQPVAFVFPSSSVKTYNLISLIKDVGSRIFSTGLKVLATVCDQGSSNVAAINKLCDEARELTLKKGGEYKGEYFIIDNEEVIPLFDPPHLLKGIRNVFLEKDLRFSKDGVKYEASWRHIQQIYAIDVSFSSRMVGKLTDHHVLPNKIKKMKVSCCTQVFSQRLGAMMLGMATRSAGLDLDVKAKDTAQLLLFLDELFDSVNGSTMHPQKQKKLRCAVQHNSGHVHFWNNAIKVLETMAFVHPISKKESRSPSLTNWVRTLKNIKKLWFLLLKKKVSFLMPRNLNQDPLENKFGAIRSYGFRNNSPSCANFVGTYKSLMLSDMVSTHSIGGNCQKDDCSVLDNLKSYILTSQNTITTDDNNNREHPSTSETLEQLPTSEDEDDPDPVSNDQDFQEEGFISRLVGSYTAGYLMKKLNNSCESCIYKQVAQQVTESHDLITQSERCEHERLLQYPSQAYTKVYSECRGIILKTLPVICSSVGVGKKLQRQLSGVSFDNITCPLHAQQYGEDFKTLVTKLLIFKWCESVNRYLSGKDTRSYCNMDKIHLAARMYYIKNKRR